ncbi:photosynthetic complex putative assembly protein PuhB [Novosphingobium sp.]|uniref:photosynthetic complex putative assembly protein PuhB n=1 Tax=Novosphingobium sp. TaxID=1874826 RepID=UPI00334126C5
MTEYDDEPIRGLPGMLPAGEEILWQGAPDWRVLARTAFSTRLVIAYFAALSAWALASALTTNVGFLGVEMTVGLGAVSVVLLHVLAYASAKSTVYTLTNRRIVLRVGIAVPKCINLPLRMIGSVDLAQRADGTGDVPLVIAGPAKLGMMALWPHARPWKIVTPQPMLRAIPDAQAVAALVARTCAAQNPEGRITITPTVPQGAGQRGPTFAEGVAA